MTLRHGAVVPLALLSALGGDTSSAPYRLDPNDYPPPSAGYNRPSRGRLYFRDLPKGFDLQEERKKERRRKRDGRRQRKR